MQIPKNIQDRKVALIFTACSVVPVFLPVLLGKRCFSIRDCGTDRVQWAIAQELAGTLISVYLVSIILVLVSRWTIDWLGFGVPFAGLVAIYIISISLAVTWVVKGIHWVPPSIFRG